MEALGSEQKAKRPRDGEEEEAERAKRPRGQGWRAFCVDSCVELTRTAYRNGWWQRELEFQASLLDAYRQLKL